MRCGRELNPTGLVSGVRELRVERRLKQSYHRVHIWKTNVHSIWL